MNNFNNVFAVIKKHCSGDLPGHDLCLDKVEADVTLLNAAMTVYQYLDVLQDLGLIEYSTHANTIILTEKGKETERLFTY